MHQIGVVGLSYRHADAGHIAGFALPREEIPDRLATLRQALGVDELVYLSTCNRVELAFAMREDRAAPDCRVEIFRALTGREPAAGEARSTLRAWSGEAAVEHLFLVACGLDSAQAGEREIAAQLRGAWEIARTAGVCGTTLDHVVGEALAMSNRVQQLAATARAPSLADLAVQKMRQHRGDQAAPVALIGVSPMTRRCGDRLHRAGVPLLIVNRSVAAAQEYAGELAQRALDDASAPVARMPVSVLSLEAFRVQPGNLSGLMAATGGTGPVLDATALGRIASAAQRPVLVVDFGLPPNIEPAAAAACGITRIGMDELIDAAQEQRIEQLMRLAPVRAAIDDRLARLRGQLAARGIGRHLADLREDFESIAAGEMSRLLEQDFPQLPAAQQEQLRRFATTIARRLAHLPLAGMRAAAEHASAETMEAFFRGARLQRGANRTPTPEDE